MSNISSCSEGPRTRSKSTSNIPDILPYPGYTVTRTKSKILPRKYYEINLEDIPSDCESVDNVVDSDSDIVVLDDNQLTENDIFECENVKSFEINDSMENNDSCYSDKCIDGIWEEKSRCFDNHPFTSDFGPNIPDHSISTLDIFFCLFPKSFIETLVRQTNLYATQTKKKFEKVTFNEMKQFLGINILMGLKKSPSYRNYWSKDIAMNDPYISSIIMNRFGFLLSNLHMADNSKAPKKGEPGFDKLYKVRSLLDTLSKTFEECYKSSQFQSCDESMIKFTGRSSLKQYMPLKPIPRGYKVWVRSDKSGFVCQFQIYEGKIDQTIEKSLGTRVIKDLT